MQKNHLAITARKGLHFIKRAEILYCCSEGAYTNIYLENNRKLTVSKNLKEVEATLQDEQFVRIHASHLVNLEHTVGYLNNNYNCVQMSNGEVLAVARSRKQAFMNCFVRL
ncbi:MAG: LytTR family DNA-binding domain-containing protein [Bacteroidota bacterium]